MATLGDIPELVKVLRRQNELLAILIAQQGSSSETPSPTRDTQLAISLPVKTFKPEPESNELNILHKLAAKYRPLVKDRAVFYLRATGGEQFRGPNLVMDENFETVIKALQVQGPRSWESVVTDAWNYWTPVSRAGYDTDLMIPMFGAGCPNFIPWWELREDGGRFFHVDDLEREEPIPISEADLGKPTMVPYSLRPPVRARVAESGITVNWNELREKLGDLYSVPSDDRLPFRFDRNELRLKCASEGRESISSYLNAVHDLFQRLYEKGGSFHVQDIDLLGRAATYRWESPRDARLETMPFHRKAVGPAVLRESYHLQITPEFYDVRTDGGSTDAVGICNWYRLINLSGLSSITGSKNCNVEGLWHLLFREESVTEWKCYQILRKAFDLHMSCSRLSGQRSIDLSRSVLKPLLFHITWFKVFSEKGTHFNGSSWDYGPLYGTKTGQYIRESAFTLAYFPRYPSYYTMDKMDSDRVERHGIDYWTILLLTSSDTGFQDTFSWLGETRYTPTYVLQLICEGLKDAADSWGAVGEHFEVILGSDNTILTPHKHDELLFDDDVFSRSRRYSWAADSLEIFLAQIEDAVNEWRKFWEDGEQMIRTFEEVHWRRAAPLRKTGRTSSTEYEPSNSDLERIEEQAHRLMEHKKRFEAFRTKTRAMSLAIQRQQRH